MSQPVVLQDAVLTSKDVHNLNVDAAVVVVVGAAVVVVVALGISGQHGPEDVLTPGTPVTGDPVGQQLGE